MKKQIELSIEKARELYSQGNKSINTILEENFSREELTKPNLPSSYDELREPLGYFAKSPFRSHKQAKSAEAAAQLSQLMHVYNDGKEVDWMNTSEEKHVIYSTVKGIEKVTSSCVRDFLAFHSKERRDLFLKNFEPLIKQYFMID